MESLTAWVSRTTSWPATQAPDLVGRSVTLGERRAHRPFDSQSTPSMGGNAAARCRWVYGLSITRLRTITHPGGTHQNSTNCILWRAAVRDGKSTKQGSLS